MLTSAEMSDQKWFHTNFKILEVISLPPPTSKSLEHLKHIQLKEFWVNYLDFTETFTVLLLISAKQIRQM